MAMTTSEGSPRAALLQQSMQRANQGAFSPVSPARPSMNTPLNGVMTLAPPSAQSQKNTNQSAVFAALLQHLQAAQNNAGPRFIPDQQHPGHSIPVEPYDPDVHNPSDGSGDTHAGGVQPGDLGPYEPGGNGLNSVHGQAPLPPLGGPPGSGGAQPRPGGILPMVLAKVLQAAQQGRSLQGATNDHTPFQGNNIGPANYYSWDSGKYGPYPQPVAALRRLSSPWLDGSQPTPVK